MKLHPPHHTDQFYTNTNEFYNIYKHFMHKFNVLNSSSMFYMACINVQ
jgi:hypothetical protein